MCKPFAVLVNVMNCEQHLVMHCDEPTTRSATDSGLKKGHSKRVIEAMIQAATARFGHVRALVFGSGAKF